MLMSFPFVRMLFRGPTTMSLLFRHMLKPRGKYWNTCERFQYLHTSGVPLKLMPYG